MSKRMTDTEKWRKGFMKGLQTPYKLLWLYIIDECDHAGIWHVEIDIASLRIGEEVTLDESISQFGDHIIPFDDGEKWFIPAFIDFQYGALGESNIHRSVIKQLKKYSLYKGFVKSSGRLMDKDKDKDKDKAKEKTKKESYSKNVERIWKGTPQKGRERSSKKELQAAWNATNPKPDIEMVLKSLETHCHSHEWNRDEGAYVQGIHRWVKSCKWEVNIEPVSTKSHLTPEQLKIKKEVEQAMFANPIK